MILLQFCFFIQFLRIRLKPFQRSNLPWDSITWFVPHKFHSLEAWSPMRWCWRGWKLWEVEPVEKRVGFWSHQSSKRLTYLLGVLYSLMPDWWMRAGWEKVNSVYNLVIFHTSLFARVSSVWSHAAGCPPQKWWPVPQYWTCQTYLWSILSHTFQLKSHRTD